MLARSDLEPWETAGLSLVLQTDHETVLVDEEAVREVARLAGYRTRGRQLTARSHKPTAAW